MSIKKLGKKLVKLGRKASKGAGKDGKRWVKAVFETAIGVIEERIEQRPTSPAKTPRTSPGRAVRRSAAPVRRKAAAGRRKTGAKLPEERARPPRKLRPSRSDQPAEVQVAPMAPEATRLTGVEDLEDQSNRTQPDL